MAWNTVGKNVAEFTLYCIGSAKTLDDAAKNTTTHGTGSWAKNQQIQINT